MTKYMPRWSGRGTVKVAVFSQCPMHRQYHSVLFARYQMAMVILHNPQVSLKVSQDRSGTDSSR
jgi:hypothetical protein